MIVLVVWSCFAKAEVAKLTEEFRRAYEQTKKLSLSAASRQTRHVEENELEGLLHAIAEAARGWRNVIPRDEEDQILEDLRELRRMKSRLMDEWANREGESDHSGLSGSEEELEAVRMEDKPGEKGEGHGGSDPAQPGSGSVTAAGGHSTQMGDSAPPPLEIICSLQLSSAQTAVVSSSDLLPPPLTPISNSIPQRQGFLRESTLPSVIASRSSASVFSGQGSGSLGARPKTKLAALSLPKFSGNKRDCWHWRRNWERLQALAEPTGSVECKLYHLLGSLDDALSKELGLSRCTDAPDIFRILDNRYGNKKTTARLIVKELEDLPAVKNNQPRQTINLIHAVESALYDL